MALLRCVKCGETERNPLVYGYPGPGMIEQARRGEVVLGGCEIGKALRPWWCDDCEPESLWEILIARARTRGRSVS